MAKKYKTSCKRIKHGIELQCERYPGTCPCPDKVYRGNRRPCPPPVFPPCPPEQMCKLMNHPYYRPKVPVVTGPPPNKPCPPPLFGPAPGMRM